MQQSPPSRNVLRLSPTESVCPVCLDRIPAERVAEGDAVYLEKSCRKHGSFRAVIWRGLESYHSWPGPAKAPSHPSVCSSPVSKGCPFDCGLCPDHRQHTCCVVLEVTGRCNLACPVCFADASAASEQNPTLEKIVDSCRKMLSLGGPYNIQLSGGEPTLRNDLPEIIAQIRALGFPFLQLNTNGIRLARDIAYLHSLKSAGLDCVFLQFDGLSDDVYRTIRGRDLLRLKIEAIRNCDECQIGVVLVPTLVPSVNVGQIGEILHFAVSQSPVVRAVHFQPISYFGRYPAPPKDEDRITIPEVLQAIESQTGGQFHFHDFHAASGENAYCSFQGKFWIAADGSIHAAPRPAQTSCCGPATGQPLVQLGGMQKAGTGEGARKARSFVAQQWAFPSEVQSQADSGLTSFDAFLSQRTRTLSVSGMAFQDAWNLDLERLRECFLHALGREQKLVPLCAYNLTSSSGEALYRHQHELVSMEVGTR